MPLSEFADSVLLVVSAEMLLLWPRILVESDLVNARMWPVLLGVTGSFRPVSSVPEDGYTERSNSAILSRTELLRIGEESSSLLPAMTADSLSPAAEELLRWSPLRTSRSLRFFPPPSKLSMEPLLWKACASASAAFLFEEWSADISSRPLPVFSRNPSGQNLGKTDPQSESSPRVLPSAPSASTPSSSLIKT